MSKRVLVISTSLRPGSNSELLARQFAQGAQEAGHTVEMISLAGRDIRFCKGCLACQTTGRCVICDDADTIVQEKMLHADVLAFATPIYYYGMSGQMKTLLDRANPLYSADYAFRQVWLLACAAEEGDEVWQRAAAAPCQCFTPAGMFTTSPGRSSRAALPSSWYQPRPARQSSTWPPPLFAWWMCQLLRQPGSKVTL